MSDSPDVRWLREALAFARPWSGAVAPNPSVGSVVVRNGAMLGGGAHSGPGHPHAEATAIQNAGDARGATIYVTLEPCNHQGRTPPCTELLIRSGIARVVYGHPDNNPKVAGQGAKRLRDAGVEVERLALPEFTTFYRSFDRASLEGLPTVTAKLAVDGDGVYGSGGPERYFITGREAKAQTYLFRGQHDAIWTTAKTVNADNPRLHSMSPQGTPRSLPLYVWDSQATMRPDSSVLAGRSLTLFHAPSAPVERLKAVRRMGATTVVLTAADRWKQAMERVVTDGHHTVWVEAGGTFLTALAETSYLHRLVLYLGACPSAAAAGPKFALPGSLPKAIAQRLSEHRTAALGDDTAHFYWAPGEEPLTT